MKLAWLLVLGGVLAATANTHGETPPHIKTATPDEQKVPIARVLSQADLLRRLVDLDRLTQPPAPGTRIGMLTRDDVTRIDEGKDSAAGWEEWAELTGPGAVTRFWTAPVDGEFKLEIDGTVVADGMLAALFAGEIAPFTHPIVTLDTKTRVGNCYYPIGFARSCRILVRGSTAPFEIVYTQFPDPVRVQSFQTDLDEQATELLREIQRSYRKKLTDSLLFPNGKGAPYLYQEDLDPGETMTQPLEEAGVIRALYVGLSDRMLPRARYVLHRCLLRIYFDGQEEPSVAVPLIDFFGSGFELRMLRSLVVGTEHWTDMPGAFLTEGRFFYNYFPMPFREGARVELQNAGDEPFGLLLYMRVDGTEPPEDALRFHAQYRHQSDVAYKQWRLGEAGGAGRLVGCVLNVDCPRRKWWGDGAFRVYLSPSRRPTFVSSGADAFFGSGGGWPAAEHATCGVSLPAAFGKESAYRWFISDDLPFRGRLRIEMENRQHEHGDIYLGSVLYWYAPLTADGVRDLEPEALTVPGLRIPGAVELEGNVLSDAGWRELQEKYAGGIEFSGREAIAVDGSQPIRTVIRSLKSREVVLKLRVHPRRPFERITVTTGDGELIGVVEYGRRDDGIFTVGPLTLEAGRTILSVSCEPRAVLDCWIIEPTAR